MNRYDGSLQNIKGLVTGFSAEGHCYPGKQCGVPGYQLCMLDSCAMYSGEYVTCWTLTVETRRPSVPTQDEGVTRHVSKKDAAARS